MAPDPPPADHPDDAARLVHDMRGALAVVVARAQLLARQTRAGGAPDRARLLAGLAEIERAAKRAAARLAAWDEGRPPPA